MTDWNQRLISLSDTIASWSKDRSTKVGAVIASQDHRVVSIGYNGFPAGFDDGYLRAHERPTKYLFTEHAERNAIYNACRTGANVVGCTMYLSWYPCADCARAIIQSGIANLVCCEPDWKCERWGDHFSAARLMFDLCRVNVEFVNPANQGNENAVLSSDA